MKPLILFFTSCITLGCYKYYYQKYRGFCEAFVQNAFVPDSKSIIDLGDEAQRILKGPLKFLDCGRQCYVFETLDEKYVVKFLSAKRFCNMGFIQKLNKQAFLKRTEMQAKEIDSYHIAFHELKDKSGLIGMKLGKSKNLSHICLLDPQGRKRLINLNDAEFFIQPKASLLKTSYNDYLQSAKELIQYRLDKMIQDSDPRIHRNLGIVNGNVIFLDLGSFEHTSFLSDDEKQQELDKIINYSQERLDLEGSIQ